MNNPELIPHLFRTEYSRIVAVLCKHFGLVHIETAEDIASETFLSALNTWSYNEIPDNPTAWLYAVAKNKARNMVKRASLFDSGFVNDQKSTPPCIDEPVDIDLSGSNIGDSQLRMLFAVCHPAIPEEAQVGLALRILCGFGIEEIANAFLTGRETIHKRLVRAREKIRSEKIQLDFPGEELLQERLSRVITTLYLLFNEGYYSESRDQIIRKDLCYEAMRLTQLLLSDPLTCLPQVNALMALMCFHSSRLDARTSPGGFIVLYQDQDVLRWNYELIARGAQYLKAASQGSSLSRYHLEAAIAYWHTVREDSANKWSNILSLYNQLLAVQYSPIAALNRIVALARVEGEAVALPEAEKLGLEDNHYFHIMIAELCRHSDPAKSKQHLEKALSLAATEPERALIRSYLASRL